MSVRHIVLFRLEPGVERDDPRVVEACAAELLLRAAPGGTGWRFGPDVSRREISADFVGVGDFDSHAAVAAFLAHPTHHGAVTAWAGLASAVVADLDLD